MIVTIFRIVLLVLAAPAIGATAYLMWLYAWRWRETNSKMLLGAVLILFSQLGFMAETWFAVFFRAFHGGPLHWQTVVCAPLYVAAAWGAYHMVDRRNLNLRHDLDAVATGTRPVPRRGWFRR